METKPNRAERRAIKSNGKIKSKSWRTKSPPKYPSKNLPQIAAPSRATRYAGLT